MLVIMTTNISRTEHADRLTGMKYLHEKVVYLLALYESDGSLKMLEALVAYDQNELDALVVYSAMARQLVVQGNGKEALETLAKFEGELGEIISTWRDDG
jgi:hypothetical protein